MPSDTVLTPAIHPLTFFPVPENLPIISAVRSLERLVAMVTRRSVD